jgi:hypothetical protein
MILIVFADVMLLVCQVMPMMAVIIPAHQYLLVTQGSVVIRLALVIQFTRALVQLAPQR